MPPLKGDLIIWMENRMGNVPRFELHVDNVKAGTMFLAGILEYNEMLRRNEILTGEYMTYGMKIWDGNEWIEWTDKQGRSTGYHVGYILA